MNAFDLTILQFLNRFAHRSFAFDCVVAFTQTSDVIKGGLMMALYWYAWTSPDSQRSRKREYLLFGLMVSAFALLVARVLAVALPYRQRPLHNALMHFQLPFGSNGSSLEGWSAFPSDHAVLFFCLATILCLISRPLGIVAMIHAVLVVCLPRVYLGLHYPTDILAGGAIGSCMAVFSRIDRVRTILTRPILSWSEKRPSWCYAIFFIISFEFAELFNTVRALLPATHSLFSMLVLPLLFLAGISAPHHPPYSTVSPMSENPIPQGGLWLDGATNGVNWGNVQTTNVWRLEPLCPAGRHTMTRQVLAGTWNSNQKCLSASSHKNSGQQPFRIAHATSWPEGTEGGRRARIPRNAS